MGTNAARLTFVLLPLSVMIAAAQSGPPPSETYAIVQSYVTANRSSDGSTGSSNGKDVLTERVIARSDGGIAREFDLPSDATADAKSRQWQFPVRVFTAPGRQMQLLNAKELEQRLGIWLAAAKLTPAACGSWIFTWNAFRIECDPRSVVASIEAIDLASQPIVEGVAYRPAEATAPLRLKLDGTVYRASGSIDPDTVRRARAEADVIVAELSRKPITMEDALRVRASNEVSGTVSVQFEVDAQGVARKRTTKTVVEIRYPDGRTEEETSTRIVERRRVTTDP